MWRYLLQYTDFSLYFYSHIPCGMWHRQTVFRGVWIHFYSHIPCGMWLIGCAWRVLMFLHFYSHIPCGMWRLTQRYGNCIRPFLLTHPLWDVTWQRTLSTDSKWFLLTHPLWDVTLRHYAIFTCLLFLLTHPLWDVTKFELYKIAREIISTHTSLVGCDCYI